MDGNLIIIGMPGAGKSTVGVLLAKRLGYDFIDSDVIIQLQEGDVLQEILDRRGYQALRAVEQDVLLSLQLTRTVLATGGSAVYSEEGMSQLAANGTVIYLRAPLSALEARVRDFEARGVAREPEQSLQDVFEERTPLYEHYAEITVDATQSADEVVAAIACSLKAR
ncbi:MAG: shikimate kinase [Gammaproteobacteria bacterium]|nr:shikimate kinase [Gammaproteobacteria bacterium]|tara:strand:- start:1405 stop:1905 length:501 start_codon:yes stop_codon:yes gene_type:complete